MSSTILKNRYNSETLVLSIRFTYDPNTVYQYPNVSPEHGNGLDTAESKGKYFSANIRPVYKTFKKVDKPLA